MRIRTAKVTDAEKIYEVHDSNGESDEWRDVTACREQIKRMIDLGFPPIVAEVDGKIVGELKAWWGEDIPALGRSLDMSTLYVHRDHQGRGIGSALVRQAVALSKKHGCNCVTVWSDPNAIIFYEKQGFQPRFSLHSFLVDTGDQSPRSEIQSRQVDISHLDPPPGRFLSTQRILHPCQRWYDLVEQAINPPLWKNSGDRYPIIFSFLIGISSEDGLNLAVYRLSYWEGDPAKAELYLWSADLVPSVLDSCILLAGQLGIHNLFILAHGEVAEKVAAFGGEVQDAQDKVLVRVNS